MKKVILIALLAMMLRSMLAMSACKPIPAEEAPVDDVAPVEEAVIDTLADAIEGEVPAETPAE